MYNIPFLCHAYCIFFQKEILTFNFLFAKSNFCGDVMAMVLFQSDMMPIFGTHITIATRAVIWTFFDVMVLTILGWFSKVSIALYSF